MNDNWQLSLDQFCIGAILIVAPLPGMTSTPTLIWAQRVNKVFVTFECCGSKNVKVSLTDGLLSIDAEAGDKTYKLENMPLWAEIDSEGSKWFSNERCDPPRLHASSACRARRTLPPFWVAQHQTAWAEAPAVCSCRRRSELTCDPICVEQGGCDHAQEAGGGVVGRAHQGQGAEAVHQGALGRLERLLLPHPLSVGRHALPLPLFAHRCRRVLPWPQVDFAKWCEEEDKEYSGEPAPGGGYDDMAGMTGGGGMGGMGGMDFSSMMGGMGGQGGMDDADFDEDDDDDLDDLDPQGLPPIGGDEDGPPPLEEVD